MSLASFFACKSVNYVPVHPGKHDPEHPYQHNLKTEPSASKGLVYQRLTQGQSVVQYSEWCNHNNAWCWQGGERWSVTTLENPIEKYMYAASMEGYEASQYAVWDRNWWMDFDYSSSLNWWLDSAAVRYTYRHLLYNFSWGSPESGWECTSTNSTVWFMLTQRGHKHHKPAWPWF